MVSLPYPSSATDQDQQAVDWLTHFFASALVDGASDIHLEPFENVLRVRVRIDGHLQERTSPHAQLKDRIISRIKVLSRMDISEKR
ncbi:MAG: hypothetical protein EBT28_06550, partial [Betaproteobacteria bacterium]|nr:hypothetical protein [Betaproteobacteria bacterium]